MSNIEKLLMNGSVGIVFKLVGVTCEDSIVGRWLTSPSSPLLAIATMTVVVGVSIVIVVLDVKSRTHLCAITFFGFACGTLKGLEVGYACRAYQHSRLLSRSQLPALTNPTSFENPVEDQTQELRVHERW